MLWQFYSHRLINLVCHRNPRPKDVVRLDIFFMALFEFQTAM